MTITTRLYTFFNGELIGEDDFGNRYFTEKKHPKSGKAKRWVIYKGIAEPSKIPAGWFSWIHYISDAAPKGNEKKHSWEKPHLPNLTGTRNAYAPAGSLRSAAIHDRTTADYEAWTPK